MADTLRVKVNKRECHIPKTVETVTQFFEHTPYGDSNKEYELYLIDGAEHIGPLGDLLVFDEGDNFVAIPKHITGG